VTGADHESLVVFLSGARDEKAARGSASGTLQLKEETSVRRHPLAVALLQFLAITLALVTCASLRVSAQGVPLAQHVVLIIEENTSFNSVFPTGMPWLVSQGRRYGYANNYVSDTGGSLLDYLYLASGNCESHSSCPGSPVCHMPERTQNFNCDGNACFTENLCHKTGIKNPITDDNIFQLMNNQPISWKVYVQNYLNAGGTVNVPDFTWANQPQQTHYYARHNAAVWYQEVLDNNLGSQGNIVDFEQFRIDVANGTLPRFAIIVPDGCWDMHDSCSSLAKADDFLNFNLTPMFAMPDFQPGGSGLLIVTFDNGNGDSQGKVYTAIAGPNVKTRFVSNVAYKHENTLRTMLESLGIETYPGWSETAASMSDFFSPNAGSVVVNAPAGSSTQGASVLVSAAASELKTKIDHMEVWDSFNGKSTKLGNVFRKTIHQTFQVSGNGTHQLTVEDIGPAPNYPALHRKVVNYTVSSRYGVFVNTPAEDSTQSRLVPVNAFAVEWSAQASSSGIDHLEVWDGSTKLGESPKGTAISQWYELAPGNYTLTIKDVNLAGNTLHQIQRSFRVSADTGVFVNSPANNSTWTTSRVPINAYAYEQTGATTPLVDHIEVWDNTHGVKLGESVTGVGLNSNFINLSVTLPGPGLYQLVIEDINSNVPYKPIHKAYVNIKVE
jgi:hypothetical protein